MQNPHPPLFMISRDFTDAQEAGALAVGLVDVSGGTPTDIGCRVRGYRLASMEVSPLGAALTDHYACALTGWDLAEGEHACRRRVHSLREAGVDEVVLVLQGDGVPHEVAMDSIRTIAERVIPHFR